MLLQIDGPNWHEKLPSIPSSSSLMSLAAADSTVELPATGQTDTAAALDDTVFETCKTEGNTLFTKVCSVVWQLILAIC